MIARRLSWKGGSAGFRCTLPLILGRAGVTKARETPANLHLDELEARAAPIFAAAATEFMFSRKAGGATAPQPVDLAARQPSQPCEFFGCNKYGDCGGVGEFRRWTSGHVVSFRGCSPRLASN